MITGAASSWFQPIRAQAVPACAALVLVLTAKPVQAQVPGGAITAGRPSITAEVVPGSLSRHTDALSFRISVEVPGQHHGYLDKGDDGFFIPLSFSFPDLAGTDIAVDPTSVPSGTRDDRVRAQVLRGRGEFAFELAPVPGSGADVTAMLRYQICNDVTNRCYPPDTLPITIVSKQMQRPKPAGPSGAKPDHPAG